jgi:hypothetical protein
LVFIRAPARLKPSQACAQFELLELVLQASPRLGLGIVIEISAAIEIDAVTRARMLNVSNPTRICKATRVGFMRSGEIF